MARFFIDRPVFAWVIAIVIMLAGALAIKELPISQYPNIAPPSVSIAVVYPGASAQTVQDTVIQVIEQQMNGVDNLEYMSAASSSDGSATITITFTQGTNPDIAQVQVQNKLQLAMPLLPQEVQQQGIRVTKSTSNFLTVIGFVSEDDSMTGDDLCDYVVSNIQDPVSRTQGVGDFEVFGAQYAMRIWLSPAKLNNYSLTTVDVINAISSQNVQVSSGQIGGLPAAAGQQLNATIMGPTRLRTPEEFGKIILKANADGSQVRLSDVATIERGSEMYGTQAWYNGKPAAAMAVKLATGANAIQTNKSLRETIEKLEPFFPHGMKVVYPYDTTPFIKISIEEVIKTLAEAIFLVFLVMYLFMQNFRATLIPTIAVPVVLLGTFAVLSAFGYSINTLTMFGVVLAIGLLVDDAIVVVENVERLMTEEGLPPKEATKKSMDQITGALVGIAMVLSAVFLPMAFFGGSTGVIYRQFSITIVSSMILSVLVALILTPALCATLLKPVVKGHHHGERGFFKWFNWAFDNSNRMYRRTVKWSMGRAMRLGLVYLLIVGGAAYMYTKIPTSFLPEEDQGIIFIQAQTPPGSNIERTKEVLVGVKDYFLNTEKDSVESIFTVAGFSFAGGGQNSGFAFVRLKDWSVRKRHDQKANAIAGKAMMAFFQLRDAQVFAFTPPAVMELGNAMGFDFQLQDRAGLGHDKLLEARNMLLGMAAQNPAVAGVRPNGVEDAPQFKVNIDWERASTLGLEISEVNKTLSYAWGSTYVNDFIDNGRVKKVYVQGEPTSRMMPDDLNKWYVRNSKGDMVPFSAFATSGWTHGAQKLERYNGVPSYEILGQPGVGYSSGQAMKEMEEMAEKLPKGIGFEWTGLSFEERLSGAQAPALYAISLIVVFLCLAALYESWSIPFAVMLVVPLGIVGVFTATLLRGLSNDVYFQVGLLTTVGLAAKNAILIVEFAKENFDHGATLVDAAVSAAHQRLRPILMTSMAFILGVLPLALADGAGSGSQNAIGTGVIGGMLSATFLAILFVPLFFVLMLRLFRVKPSKLSGTADVAMTGMGDDVS